MKPGVHRAVARDGTVAAVIVAPDGRIIDLIQVGELDAPQDRSTRWIAPSLAALRQLAEKRRLEAWGGPES